jgi:hypothetical protein
MTIVQAWLVKIVAVLVLWMPVWVAADNFGTWRKASEIGRTQGWETRVAAPVGDKTWRGRTVREVADRSVAGGAVAVCATLALAFVVFCPLHLLEGDE